EIRALSKRAQVSGWRDLNSAGTLVELLPGATTTSLFAFDGHVNLPKTLEAGFPAAAATGLASASPASGTVVPISAPAATAAAGFPCSFNGAPCFPPPSEPECPPGGSPGPRGAVASLSSDLPVSPQCPPCDQLCLLQPRPTAMDCPCIASCTCN